MFDYILDYIGIIQKMKKARILEFSRFLTIQSTGDERIELFPQGAVTPDLWGLYGIRLLITTDYYFLYPNNHGKEAAFQISL